MQRLVLFLGVWVIGLLPLSTRGQQPGTLRWVYNSGSLLSTSPAIGADDAIYFTATNRLICLNTNGSLRWALTNILIPSGWSAPTIGEDGTIYVCAGSTLLAANPNGTWNWAATTNGSGSVPVGIANDGSIIVGAGRVYCVNTDGTRRWAMSTFNGDSEPPAIARDGTIFFGSYHANVYAITPEGSQIWTLFPGGGLWYFSPSLGADGTLYGCMDNKLLALHPDKTTNWIFQADEVLYSSSVVGTDGTIYFCSGRGSLYALNGDGSVKWTNSPVGGSCPLLTADAGIYCMGGKGVIAFETNGTRRWEYTNDPSIRAAQGLALGGDGTIYFVSNSGQLVALYGNSPLANSPWPTWRRDQRHTSRAGGTATRPPRLTISQNPGFVNLSATCDWGRSYRLQYSSELTNWQTITNFEGQMQPSEFPLSQNPTNTAIFYRVVSP